MSNAYHRTAHDIDPDHVPGKTDVEFDREIQFRQLVKLGLAHGLVELRLEFGGHPTDLRGHLTDRTQGAGQVLRADDDQGNGADHHYLTPAHVQHGAAWTFLSPKKERRSEAALRNQPTLCSVVAGDGVPAAD